MAEAAYLAEALRFFKDVIGKEGPFYYDCSMRFDEPGVPERFVIGKEGRPVTLDDIIATLRKVSKNKILQEVYVFHEGYRVSNDGKTLEMMFGT
ncbi:hypothetical protein ACHAWF_005706 [Thalassiosira exigua]